MLPVFAVVAPRAFMVLPKMRYSVVKILAFQDAELENPDISRALFIYSLLENMEDGQIKLLVVRQTLRFWHQYAALFRLGGYLKINVYETGSDQLLTFARQDQNNSTIIVVSRLTAKLNNKAIVDVWGDTGLELPKKVPNIYQELFIQCRISAEQVEDNLQLKVREVLEEFIFAVLLSVVE